MASVFKRKRDRSRKNSSWFIAYSDENGVSRTVKGCPDKAATEGIARKLESDAEQRRRGVIDGKSDGYVTHGKRPLEEHVHDFGGMMEAKESTAKHVLMTCRFVRELARMTGITSLRDLTSNVIQTAMSQLREDGLSARTVNSYLRGVKSFTRWLVKDGRIQHDPLTHLSSLNEKTDRRRVRRALTHGEAPGSYRRQRQAGRS